MANELLRAVQTAEENADLILQEAQRSARELIKNAEAEITEHERNVALEHRALYQSIMEERRRSVEARIAANAPAVQQRQDAGLSTARGRLESVAHRLFERVVSDGDR